MFGEKHTLAFTILKGNAVINKYWIKPANCYTTCITLSNTMTVVAKTLHKACTKFYRSSLNLICAYCLDHESGLLHIWIKLKPYPWANQKYLYKIWYIFFKSNAARDTQKRSTCFDYLLFKAIACIIHVPRGEWSYNPDILQKLIYNLETSL